MKFLFLQTGGTIDKDYPHTTKGWAFEFGEPGFIRILDKLKPSFDYDTHTVFQKDSLEITDADRQQLTKFIQQHISTKIIITHGTDTMTNTAAALVDGGILTQGKTVVITGALNPARFRSTDAIFNVGMAMAAVQCRGPGVFICMNGQVFPGDKVVKNRDKMAFELID